MVLLVVLAAVLPGGCKPLLRGSARRWAGAAMLLGVTGTLHLPETKTGKRDIVVSDEVMWVLAKIAAEKGKPKRGLVVCSPRGKQLWSLCRNWRHARKLAGIPDGAPDEAVPQ